MVQISKEEAKMVRTYMPDVHMKRTVHKYYAESSPALLRLLRTGSPGKDVKRSAK